jgi:RNA polymerase-binding transcription factor DksA
MPEPDKTREQLQARLEALEARLAEIEETLREPEEDDWQEQAAELDEDEVLGRLARAGRDEIALIRGALKRFDQGTYGKCPSCGKPIDPRRLKALPEVTNCIRCARSSR